MCCLSDSVRKLFGETIHDMFECGCYFVVEGALLDIACMVFQRVCACRCSFHMLCLCFCMSEVISSLKSLRTGSHVFVLFKVYLCVSCILYYGRSL